jgi:hypothetical protein
VSGWLRTSDWLRVKCSVFLIFLLVRKNIFICIGLLFVFTFIERVDWVVIV